MKLLLLQLCRDIITILLIKGFSVVHIFWIYLEKKLTRLPETRLHMEILILQFEMVKYIF